MWVQRTPDEIAEWEKAAEIEARSYGRLIAGMVWILVSLLAAGGWFAFFGGGAAIAVQRDVSGGFWSRFPILAVVVAPFAYWLFRREKQKELAKIVRRTICPSCDTADNDNAGVACKCGGSFVLTSSMKWVEK